VQDYLFYAPTGQLVIDRPAGFGWGTSELDARTFWIVRADLPPDVANKLRSHLLKIADKGDWLSGNVWRSASFKAVPEAEQVRPRTFINLRSGSEAPNEDAAWAGTRPGDVIFVTSSWGGDPAGWAFKVIDPAARSAQGRNDLTLKEAQAWTS
jgi:hypothetical protein